MKRISLRFHSSLFILFVFLVIVTLAIWVVQGREEATPESNTITSGTKQEKSDDGKNGVTFSAALLPNTDGNLTFKVKIDTHSGDLSQVDFKREVVLEKDGKTYSATSTSLSGEGHHLEAIMDFPIVEFPFTLVAENIRGIERRELVF